MPSMRWGFERLWRDRTLRNQGIRADFWGRPRALYALCLRGFELAFMVLRVIRGPASC